MIINTTYLMKDKHIMLVSIDGVVRLIWLVEDGGF